MSSIRKVESSAENENIPSSLFGMTEASRNLEALRSQLQKVRECSPIAKQFSRYICCNTETLDMEFKVQRTRGSDVSKEDKRRPLRDRNNSPLCYKLDNKADTSSVEVQTVCEAGGKSLCLTQEELALLRKYNVDFNAPKTSSIFNPLGEEALSRASLTEDTDRISVPTSRCSPNGLADATEPPLPNPTRRPNTLSSLNSEPYIVQISSPSTLRDLAAREHEEYDENDSLLLIGGEGCALGLNCNEELASHGAARHQAMASPETRGAVSAYAEVSSRGQGSLIDDGSGHKRPIPLSPSCGELAPALAVALRAGAAVAARCMVERDAVETASPAGSTASRIHGSMDGSGLQHPASPGAANLAPEPDPAAGDAMEASALRAAARELGVARSRAGSECCALSRAAARALGEFARVGRFLDRQRGALASGVTARMWLERGRGTHRPERWETGSGAYGRSGGGWWG